MAGAGALRGINLTVKRKERFLRMSNADILLCKYAMHTMHKFQFQNSVQTNSYYSNNPHYITKDSRT